jgi:hypothetical protein
MIYRTSFLYCLGNYRNFFVGLNLGMFYWQWNMFGFNGQEEEDGYLSLCHGIAVRVNLLVGGGRELK